MFAEDNVVIKLYRIILVKPQESRPDTYFEIYGWEDSETVIVDFCLTKADGEKFNGQYTFNIKTNTVAY